MAAALASHIWGSVRGRGPAGMAPPPPDDHQFLVEGEGQEAQAAPRAWRRLRMVRGGRGTRRAVDVGALQKAVTVWGLEGAWPF